MPVSITAVSVCSPIRLGKRAQDDVVILDHGLHSLRIAQINVQRGNMRMGRELPQVIQAEIGRSDHEFRIISQIPHHRNYRPGHILV